MIDVLNSKKFGDFLNNHYIRNMKLTLSKLKKPLNHSTLGGKPMLFAVLPKSRLVTGGEAVIEYNIMNGKWMVSGQKDSPTVYSLDSLKLAIKIAKTVNHFNSTGERKQFKSGDISELCLV